MEIKTLFRELEHHNDWCYRTAYTIYGIKIGDIKHITMKEAEAVRQQCVEYGIDICCIMRMHGCDAVVDTLSGYVSPRNTVDMEELRADGEKRYLTFEYVGEDCDE